MTAETTKIELKIFYWNLNKSNKDDLLTVQRCALCIYCYPTFYKFKTICQIEKLTRRLKHSKPQSPELKWKRKKMLLIIF